MSKEGRRNELSDSNGSAGTERLAEADKKAEKLMCEYTCAKDWSELAEETWSAPDVHDILMKAFLSQNTENNHAIETE